MLLLALWTACTTPPTPADELGWMVGSWQRVDDEVTTVERWQPAPGGPLLGSGSVRAGRALVFAETMLIQDGPEGRSFTAWPEGQAPVRFDLVLRGAREVGFENRGHDFPQRLIYRAVDGGLAVEATGVDAEGAPREQRWELVAAP
ncbi:MAG: hypothetical protein H6732_09875 [Alphaproteobacteria bacterium]|nr:hypothetical protein [Alphaproteobacteria bacterium]